VDRAGHDEPFGRLILGLSPRLADDDEYRDFLRLVTASVATALSNAEAFDEQRRRAEALAEIDRAKTAFFTNISHEFRTPLTLLLGPLERLAASPTTSAADRAEAEVAARNANRLLRLVNTLLEFSRLEAGRTTARYEPTDLAELTADLASTFRSAFDRAGVALRLDLAPLSRAAYVDRDMWERIVLNLLSNAFKYTLQGEVAVTLREEAGEAALAVSDTGSGIPPDELPRLFERFHRIEGIPSRSHEGTGIGLALAAELAALHAGRIDVESEPGRGSVFTVRLPLGREHLPPERIVVRGAETATGGLPQRRAFADEALSWIADQPSDTPAREAASDGPDARPGRVLVVDDNADMREYVRRVLSDFDVDTAANTAEAIARLEASPPDIVVSDVMMPGDDGLALLDAIRRDPDRRTIPVILVSARAGPEAQREALEVGADDYLVKPFAAADLRARVGAHLAAARLRSQAVEDLRGALAAKDDFLGMVSHELRTPLTTILGHARLLDTPGRATTPDLLRDEIDDIRAEAERLNRIVENLLVVARLDAGRVAESEPLLADRLIIGAVARTRREHPDHEFRHAAAAEPAFVEANAGYLEQVLTNLLGNAAKYSPPGTTIETSSHIVDGEFVVRVEDRGPGIEPAELGAIFDPFYRSERTSGQAGLGLGLAVCRRLVESMGGWLRASPREGGGATFSFGLPLANADEA
jgi:signal transduction histidine kinase